MSQSLAWSSAFSVAHPALDAEHREIMLAIRRVDQAGDDQDRLRPVLYDLKLTASAHFVHEGAILRGIAAATSTERRSRKFVAAMTQAVLDEHLAEHDIALALLDQIIRQKLAEQGAKAPAIGEALTHWFINHAVRHDAHLKTLFQTIEQDCPELLDRVV